MFGASFLKLVKFFLKGGVFDASGLAILGVGCAVAFVVSLIAIKWLMAVSYTHLVWRSLSVLLAQRA